jgi:hypothetical protein
MLTAEQLVLIEAQSTNALPSLLRVHANEVRSALASLTGELRCHAAALLLKLEHLDHEARAEPAGSSMPAYLAPCLTLETSLLVAA